MELLATRAEEIEREAHRISQNGDEYLSFIQGAEWADETMIKKAREWVKNAFISPFGEGLANNIADEFVKAMKK